MEKASSRTAIPQSDNPRLTGSNGSTAVENLPKQAKARTLGFSWGTVDVYFYPAKKQEIGAERHEVLSGGVPQFKTHFPLARDREQQPLPFNVVLDVHANVGPGNANYPFDHRRGDWRRAVRDDVAQVYSYVDRLAGSIRGELVAREYAHLETMPLLDPLKPRAVDKDEIKPLDLGGPRSHDVQRKFATAIHAVPTDTPLLHSNLGVDIRPQIDVALKRGNGGPSANQMFSEIGSFIVHAKQAVSKIPGYEGLARYHAGILLDRGYSGLRVSQNSKAPGFQAVLVNIFHKQLYESLDTPKKVAGALFHHLMRESVGHRVAQPSTEFASELDKLDAQLRANGTHKLLMGMLTETVDRNWSTYEMGRVTYEHTGETALSESVAGTGASSGHPGAGAGNAESGNRAVTRRRREPGISAGVGGPAGGAGKIGAGADAGETGAGIVGLNAAHGRARGTLSPARKRNAQQEGEVLGREAKQRAVKTWKERPQVSDKSGRSIPVSLKLPKGRGGHGMGE